MEGMNKYICKELYEHITEYLTDVDYNPYADKTYETITDQEARDLLTRKSYYHSLEHADEYGIEHSKYGKYEEMSHEDIMDIIYAVNIYREDHGIS